MNDLLFRNIEFDADAPVDQWPAEAVTTALERGSLRHWRAIAQVVRNDPWGPLARIVEQAVDATSPYGVGPGMLRIVAGARQEQDRADKAEVARELSALVERSGLTARQSAEVLGTSASRMSTYLSGKVTPSAAFLVRARRLLSRVPTSQRNGKP